MIERLQADLRAARLARDSTRVGALGMLLASLQGAAKEAGGTLSDQDAHAVLRRERKRRAEAAASYREGGREEQAAAEEAESALIDSYLPAELDATELDALVEAAIAETGAASVRDQGAVIKLVMARSGGRADGRAVSALVRARLAG